MKSTTTDKHRKMNASKTQQNHMSKKQNYELKTYNLVSQQKTSISLHIERDFYKKKAEYLESVLNKIFNIVYDDMSLPEDKIQTIQEILENN